MAGTQKFGAGIWHFATYVDRYATDGYGEPRSVIDAIDLAGQVEDLSVVDINYPFFGGDFTNEQVDEALNRNNLGVIGITPGDLHPRLRQGRLHQPRPGHAAAGPRADHRSRRRRPPLRRRLRQALARPGRLGLSVPGRPRHAVEALARRRRPTRQRESRPQVRHRVQAARAARAHELRLASPAPCSASRRSACPTSASCSTSATRCSAASRRPTPPSWPSTTAGCSAWTSTTTCAAGTTTWSPAPCTRSSCSSSSTRLRKNKWEGVWQLTSSPSARTASSPPTTPSTSSRPPSARLDKLDFAAMQKAQDDHDALGALALAQRALFSCY